MSTAELYERFLKHPQITTDSRNCPEGSIFFALHGENFNGNKFAKSALEKGCRLAVVDSADVIEDERYIFVDDTLKALQNLANFHRKSLGTTIIGITGTNGKTTTKELIAAILQTEFNTLFTQGNLNNHIGVPLTLLNLTSAHEIGIVEMGANHPGEIAELCAIADPDAGIITNVGKAHLEGFGSFEGVIKTKTELYAHIRKKNGLLFVNSKNKILKEAAGKLNIHSYGDGSVSIASSWPTLTIAWHKEASALGIETKLSGAYNLENIAAAIAIGEHFGVSPQHIKDALENYTPSNNRSQIIQSDFNTVIMDAYNANPTSMLAALTDFANADYKQKVLILGDMKELGTYSREEHSKLITEISRLKFDRVFLVGTEFKKVSHICSDFYYFSATEDLIAVLKQSPLTNATVLVKGSRSMKLEQLVPQL